MFFAAFAGAQTYDLTTGQKMHTIWEHVIIIIIIIFIINAFLHGSIIFSVVVVVSPSFRIPLQAAV